MAPGVAGEAVVFLVFKLKIAWNRLFMFPGVCFVFQTKARVTMMQTGIKSCYKAWVEVQVCFTGPWQVTQELFP